MPYIYIGEKAIFHGRPLFKILSNLKNFGVGRIVYKNDDYVKHPDQIHFYRILLAQPLMDEKNMKGNVVAEKVFKGIRSREPVVISDLVERPDFRLVPKDEESAFCQLDKIKDYDVKTHAPTLPKSLEMGPLLREVLRRNKSEKGLEVREEDFRLPAHEIYRGDHNLEDKVSSHSLGRLIPETYRTFEDYDVNLKIPEEWNYERVDYPVGRKQWIGFTEGFGWEEQHQRDLDEEALKKAND